LIITKKFKEDHIEFEAELSFNSKLKLTREMFNEARYDTERYIIETLQNSIKEEIYMGSKEK